MGKEYKLVELTEEEQNGLTRGGISEMACSKCVAKATQEVCDTLDGVFGDCTNSAGAYFIEVDTDDK